MLRFLLLSALLATSNVWASQKVELVTNLGTLEVELDEAAAPASVANFLRYVEDGSYEGSIFHRLIPGFVVQGGGFDSDYQKLPTYRAVESESDNGLQNLAGTLAMARTQDPNSATRQFYINLSDNPSLNGDATTGYTVFGKVVAGQEVLTKMAKVPTHVNTQLRARDVPKEPIILEQVRTITTQDEPH